MSNPHLQLAHLYPRTMSTYGDLGNITCLVRRCEWRGIEVTVHEVEIGEPIPAEVDLYFFGGGQDAAQASLETDLLEDKATRLREDIRRGVPLLAVCGGYQLLGDSYHPFEGPALKGVGIFPVETRASKKRMIGDLVIEANPELKLAGKFSTIVGFENHSGQTRLTGSEARPLGRVRHGYGNNNQDQTEGCVIGSAIGCYLHGSLLPKNPHLADWLLTAALRQRDSEAVLASLDDTLEWEAHAYIVGRYA